MSDQDYTEQHTDQPQPKTRRKSNRAAKKTNSNTPTVASSEGNVETKTKDGRHRRTLPSGATAVV